MATQSNPAVVDTEIVEVIAHPGLTEDEVQIKLGGIVVFRNNFPQLPDFVIEFVQPGPPGTSGPLTGTTDSPIAVQMPDDEPMFTYTYNICYKKDGRTPVLREGPFGVRQCQVCPPPNQGLPGS